MTELIRLLNTAAAETGSVMQLKTACVAVQPGAGRF